ncbi:CAP-Gly domain-containing linker protein 4 (Restin-like protein 2) [Durusdinium trenchii]|uniref:CAP-Gly domain-containing linker protein 4 (Restin-like protein 2) n=1 Tax=Durusdinium trenchii TaxID=1381693 RepID=A0ABP0SLR9_9DINO
MAAVTKDELAIGTKVTIKVKEQEMLGFIRFQGTTDFSEGDWVGIELEEPRGKNDGSVAEKRYFTCKPEHGLFVRPFHVLRIEDTKENGERNLRLELAEAVEENDDVAIERLLPEAEKKGVIEQELDLARSRLKSIRRSPIQVRELEEDTSEQGGQDVQENYEHMLERLLQQTQEKVRQGFAPKELDLARSLVKSMGMTAQGQQLAMAEAVKDQNEETIEQQLLEAEKTGAAEQEMKTSQRSPTTEPEAAGENYKDTLKWLLHEAKKKGLAEKELEMARSLLQSIERPKELQEPENEDTPLIDLLGGQDEIKKCRLMSQKIGQLVQDMVREGEAAAQQPYIYQGMGLEHMLELATGFKKTFDSLCHKLAEKVQGKEEFGGWKVSYMDAPIKSKASAESKVNTEYHGDCRQLKDVVRGTLVIDGNVDTTSIETVYKLLEQLVKSEELLRDANARFTRFSDRYQNPVGPSQYRDFLFLLKIGDFLCELQMAHLFKRRSTSKRPLT